MSPPQDAGVITRSFFKSFTYISPSAKSTCKQNKLMYYRVFFLCFVRSVVKVKTCYSLLEAVHDVTTLGAFVTNSSATIFADRHLYMTYTGKIVMKLLEYNMVACGFIINIDRNFSKSWTILQCWSKGVLSPAEHRQSWVPLISWFFFF